MVGEEGHVGAAEEKLGHRETGVALEQLQATVTRVSFELDLEGAAKPDAADEPKAELPRLPVRVADRIGAEAEAGRELSDLVERCPGQRLAARIEIAAVGRELVLAAGNQLRDHHVETQGVGPLEGKPELVGVTGDDQLVDLPEVVLEAHRASGLQDAGEVDLGDHRL